MAEYPPQQIAMCAGNGDWWPYDEPADGVCVHAGCEEPVVIYARSHFVVATDHPEEKP